MKCPAEIYQASPRPYQGLPDIDYPFHDRTIVVRHCGRICLGKKKINFSTVSAGQAVGIMYRRICLRCIPPPILITPTRHFIDGFVTRLPGAR